MIPGALYELPGIIAFEYHQPQLRPLRHCCDTDHGDAAYQLVSAFLLFCFSAFLLFCFRIKQLSLCDYYSYECNTAAAESDKSGFSVPAVASSYARKVADKLCADKVFQHYYSGVKIR